MPAFGSRATGDFHGPGKRGPPISKPVADRDLHWEASDHTSVPAEDRTVADPWEHEERHKTTVAIAGVIDEKPVTGEIRDDGLLIPQLPLSEQARGPVEKPSDHAARHAESGLLTAEELLDIEEIASDGEKFETNDWTDLEEAEDDLVHASDEIGAGAERDTDTDAFRTDDDKFEELDVTLESADAVSDGDSGNAFISGDSVGDLTFDAPEDDAATYVVEAELHERVDRDFGVYEFDADARQALWDFDPDADETAPRRAREKAAAITALVDVANRREQGQVLAFLIELFEHLAHPATFHAIFRVAEEGLTPELLQAMVALRREWMERTDWWKGRYGRGFEVSPLRKGASALSWVLARRVCRARPDHPPEAMIDDEWFDEWLCLSPGEPGFLSFPAYVDVKVRTLEANLLDYGLLLKERLDRETELGDDFGWYRRISDQEDVVRFGFHVLNPYGDGLLERFDWSRTWKQNGGRDE